ncbi:MAG: ABC transporter ATP-binding protein [Pseudomonadota bacterium]
MINPITAKGLIRRYGDATIVNGVDITLQPSTVTALLGASGAGKSSLLRMIAGLEVPDAGTVSLGDTPLSGPGLMVPAERRRIGLIFQDFALFPHMTALDNVRFGLADMSRSDGEALAADWLVRVGLGDRLQSYPHQLSGGEQQRVAIARALAPSPVAILMDEPFSGLDPSLRQDVREAAMAAVKEVGIPALIVSHDAEEAMMLADDMAIMHRGKIIQHGSPDEIYSAPVSPRVAAALGTVNDLQGALNGNGLVETAFGPVAAPAEATVQRYRVIIRPEAVKLSAQGRSDATILSVRRIGHVYQAEINANGHTLLAWSADPVSVQPGTTVSVHFDEAGCFVFPAE